VPLPTGLLLNRSFFRRPFRTVFGLSRTFLLFTSSVRSLRFLRQHVFCLLSPIDVFFRVVSQRFPFPARFFLPVFWVPRARPVSVVFPVIRFKLLDMLLSRALFVHSRAVVHIRVWRTALQRRVGFSWTLFLLLNASPVKSAVPACRLVSPPAS